MLWLPSSVHPPSARCPSHGYISKTEQDRPVVTMEHIQMLPSVDIRITDKISHLPALHRMWCGACRRKWRLTDTDLCPCGETNFKSCTKQWFDLLKDRRWNTQSVRTEYEWGVKAKARMVVSLPHQAQLILPQLRHSFVFQKLTLWNLKNEQGSCFRIGPIRFLVGQCKRRPEPGLVWFR